MEAIPPSPGKRKLFGISIAHCNALDASTAVAGLLSRLDKLLTSVLIPNRPRHHPRQLRIVVYDPTPRLIRFPTPKKIQQ